MTKSHLERANAQEISGEECILNLDADCRPYASLMSFDVYADGKIVGAVKLKDGEYFDLPMSKFIFTPCVPYDPD